MREKWFFRLLFALAILGYLLPWIMNNASGLTMGAYDFAEFLSKSPTVNPQIYLLLRGQLFLLTAFLVFGAQKPFFTADWWMRAILGAMLIIAQLPALNMIGSLFNDANRQQQVILAALSLFVLLLGLSGLVSRWSRGLQGLILLAALATSVYALLSAIEVMRPYGMNSELGFGVFLYGASLLLLLLLSIYRIRRSTSLS